MIDHNMVSMTQISKQQKQIEEERLKKQVQRKDAILVSAYSTKYVDDMIEINENEIDSLKQKINQTMSNFDERIHILQRKNEINIAENFKDIIFSLSHELDKMSKLVDSLTHGQGVTTQSQLKLSIQLVREYKEEYQKVYDAFLKVSRENKQWNIKVHTLRDRVRELEEQVNRQEQYLDFFKKKYNINIDSELAKLQQIEKEKNIDLMEDIKIYLNKNNGKDNELSDYQKFIKNFIFDKYTFTILDLFQETDKMIYNLRKQYQFSPQSDKTNPISHRSKMKQHFREQRAENYYYQLFVKCVNELQNSQQNFDEQQKQEDINQIIQQIQSKNTMLNFQPEELLKLFLSDNNVQQLIRKHIFQRQSQLHQQFKQNNNIINLNQNNNMVNQGNNMFLSNITPNSTINNNKLSTIKINNGNNHSMDEIQQYPQTTNNARHKYQNRRQNIDYYTDITKKMSILSKPESPVVSKDRSFIGSGGQLPTPIQTPTIMNRVRMSSELGHREIQQSFKTNNQMKAKTPQHQQNNLSINTQDESFDINQNGQPSTAIVSALNSSRQQQSSSKKNSMREIELLNSYLSSLNPRWRHNPTSNEKLKSQQLQQKGFFQTQIQRYSPVRQYHNNN